MTIHETLSIHILLILKLKDNITRVKKMKLTQETTWIHNCIKTSLQRQI